MKNLLSDSSRSVSYGDLDVEADKVPIGADVRSLYCAQTLTIAEKCIFFRVFLL